jgi:hypothetical protein
MRSTWWSGLCATRFESYWQRQHAAAVRVVAQLLSDTSGMLRAQSGSQRDASELDPALGVGSGTVLLTSPLAASNGMSQASDSDRALTNLEQLHEILDIGKDGSEAARESVRNAARALSTSGDPEVRSTAGYILSNFGKDTRFVDTPAFKWGGRGVAALGFLLDVAKYSAQHKSVVEVVTRSSLETGFSLAGAAGGAAVGAAACVEIPIVGSAACGFVGGVLGGLAGDEVGEVVGGLAFGDYRVVGVDAPRETSRNGVGGGGGSGW